MVSEPKGPAACRVLSRPGCGPRTWQRAALTVSRVGLLVSVSEKTFGLEAGVAKKGVLKNLRG